MNIVIDNQIQGISDLIKKIKFRKDINFILINSDDFKNKNLKKADIILIRSVTNVDKDLVLNTNIKKIYSATSGKDHVNLDLLDKSKIEYFFASGANSSSVAHYVMSALHKIKNYSGIEKKVGIVGYGNVGKKVKNILDHLQIRNCTYDPYLNESFLTDINEIYECEIITFHVPLTYNNKYPTNKFLKPDLLEKSNIEFIINTSRGGVIQEDLLKKNPEIKYICDVWEGEPIIDMEILESSFIASPHIAGHSIQGKNNATLMLISKLIDDFNLVDDKASAKNIIQQFKKNNPIKRTYKDLADFDMDFNLNLESERFKSAIRKSNESDIRKVFVNSRKNHIQRFDYDSL